MKVRKVIAMLTLFFFFATSFAQVKKTNSFSQFSGSIGFFYDMYSFSEENYPTFRPRFPNNLLRFNMEASLTFGKYLSIPMSINVSNQKIVYNLPSLPEENLVDYIQNPANNISINPSYKWIKASLGTHSPMYSPLTTGDVPIFGAGLELNPGKIIVSASYGISQRAIEPNLALNLPGAFEQRMMAVRIGVGKVEASKFTLNIVKVKDDVNSVNTMPLDYNPMEGITFAPLLQFKIAKKLHLSTETAGSVYTDDILNANELDIDFARDVSKVIKINATSKVDIAHNSRIEWKGEKVTVGGEVKYIGPRFLSAGYRFIERDILDYKLNTTLNLFKQKVNLSGSFGIRTNNLRNNNLASTKRIISNVTFFGQLSKNLSLNASYSNFGIDNDAKLLNQRVELVNNSISVSPSYTFKTLSTNHQIGLNYSLNDFNQLNVVSNTFEQNTNNTYGANYALLFLKIPLHVNLQGLYLQNKMILGNFKMLNYGCTVGYKLFEKKLIPSLAINVAHINKEGYTTDYRTGLQLKCRYKATKKLQIRAAYRFTGYKYGSSRANALVNQNRIQFSIQQKI